MAEANDHEKMVMTAGNPAVAPQRPLRVMTASSLGTVGKSMTSEFVLLPGLGTNHIYSVEAENVEATKYGVPIEQFAADEITEMWRRIARNPNPVVVDLGASDFTNFVKQLFQANLFSSFDYCVLVSDTSERGQAAAISTYETFKQFGMQQNKFRLVLNRANLSVRNPKEAVRIQYPHLFRFAERDPDFWIDAECVIPEMEKVFQALKETRLSLRQVLEDDTDYEELAWTRSNNGDHTGADEASRLMLASNLARRAQTYFVRAFKKLDLHSREGNNGV